MLPCRPGTVKKAVFVTVPGLQRTMSGRENAPKVLMLRCARDTQLTHLFLDRPLSEIRHEKLIPRRELRKPIRRCLDENCLQVFVETAEHQQTGRDQCGTQCDLPDLASRHHPFAPAEKCFARHDTKQQ